jgi:hypothetical protein
MLVHDPTFIESAMSRYLNPAFGRAVNMEGRRLVARAVSGQTSPKPLSKV